MKITVSGIQRMCLDDGPGIRTNVFLMGCELRCPWCSNPECIPLGNQLVCEKELLGTQYEPWDLVNLLKKDKVFWERGGGVTFSGGEPLLQAPGLKEAWELLKKDGIHLVAETSLFVPEAYLSLAMSYIDFFYVDVKLLDRELCREILGGRLELYIKNVRTLSENGKEIHFRLPCSEKYVLDRGNMELVYSFLEQYARFPVEIFALHNMGDTKYKALGLKPPESQAVSGKRLEAVRWELKQRGIRSNIIKI